MNKFSPSSSKLYHSSSFLRGAALSAAMAVLPFGAFATDFNWTSSSAANWSSTIPWTSVPAGTSGPPSSTDSITTGITGSLGRLIIDSTTVDINNWTHSGSGQEVSAPSVNGAYTLNIDGTLTRSGSNSLTFRNNSSAQFLSVDVAAVSLASGTISFGQGVGAQSLNGATVQTATLTGGAMNFKIGDTSGFASITGSLSMSGSSFVRVRESSGAGQSGTLNVASLSSSVSTPVIEVNTQGTNAATGTLALINGSGTSTYQGILRNGGTAGNVLAVTKSGAGTQVLSAGGAMSYTGSTTITGGTLRVNKAHTGGGAYLVSGTGTLSGSGTITLATDTNVTLGNGGKLSAGGADNAVGTLTAVLSGTGTLDITTGVSGGNTGALVFDLDASSGDQVALTTGALTIGSGVLNFNDFSFNALGSLNTSTPYTLFNTGSTIVGTLGSSLTGAIGSGYTGTLSLANGNTDVILTVTAVPEPGAIFMLTLGLTVLGMRRRVRR